MSDEADRLRSIASLVLFRAENYVRTLRQAVSGLGVQLADKPDACREAFAVEQVVGELADWLKEQRTALANPEAAEGSTSEVANKTDATASDAVVLH